MFYIFLFGLIILIICSVFVRTIIFNPHYSVYYAGKDLIHFFIYKLYNVAPTGRLDCYAADFGGGKTLSMAHYIYNFNKRYNGKKFYDIKSHRWVMQHVIVLSNFTVNGVDCIPMNTLQDVVSFTQSQKSFDQANSVRTCLLVAIDEASCQLNSRNFKSNIDPLFLNTLITCRHYNINMIYSSQQFFLTDKLLRDVTQRVIHCKKMWRVMKLEYYDAHVVENAGTLETLKPLRRSGWFIRDFHFNLYDTLSTVDNLVKDDSMLSYDEILSNLGDNSYDLESNSKHKYRKYRKSK